MRPTVFGSFIQGSRASGGYGLGLAIVRKLVALMDGSIRIIDRKGPGTLFRFDLVLKWTESEVVKSGSLAQLMTESPHARDGAPGSELENGGALGEAENGELGTSELGSAFMSEDRSVTPGEVTSKTADETLCAGLQLPLPPEADGASVLLLKADRAGRETAAGWMSRRGLRVYQAEAWSEVGCALKAALEGREYVPTGEKAGKGAGENRHVVINVSDEISVIPLQRMGSENPPLLDSLPETPTTSSESEPSLKQGVKPRLLLLIIDTSAVPGAPSPLEISAAFQTLIQECDLTAPSAPRVVAAWLVSVALPGPAREQLRAAGCHIMACDLLHPSRLLSLLTTMVTDDPESHESLLCGPFGASQRSDNRPYSEQVKHIDEESQEAMLQAGVGFVMGRGVVDHKGPDIDEGSDQSAHSSHPGKLVGAKSYPPSPTLRPKPAPSPLSETARSASWTMERLQAESAAKDRNPLKGAEPLPKIPGSPTTRKALEGVHILLVEDTVLLRKLAVTMLVKLGANVFPVENGQQVRIKLLSPLLNYFDPSW